MLRKLAWLLCLLLLVPVLAAAEAPTISDAEAFQSYLNDCQAQSLTSFSAVCTPELYEALTTDSYAELYRATCLAGLKNFSFRSNSRTGEVQFSNVEYGSPNVFECATEEEVRQVITSVLEQGLPSFTLYTNDELHKTLNSDSLLAKLMGRLGAGDFDYQVSYSKPVIFVENVAATDVPPLYARDLDEAIQLINTMRAQAASAFTLFFDQELFDALTREERQLMLFLSGVDDYSLTQNFRSCGLHFTEVVYTDDVCIYCTSEADFVAELQALGRQGCTSFRFMLDEATYNALYEGYFSHLYELQAKAGLLESDLRYSGVSRLLLFSNAVFQLDLPLMSTMDEVVAYVDECVAKRESEINLLMTAELYDDLMEGISSFALDSGDSKFYDLIANAGIATGDAFTYNKQAHTLSLKGVQLYTGMRAIQAMENGTLSDLTEREQETLITARRMAAQCRRSTETETAQAIHDLLCQHITYVIDESTEEDDCAIGALLDGRANCDGYADAMYLVGTLAGLNVRYQHGDSLEGGLSSLFSTHMWNLIELDGAWRMIDVTWDDSGENEDLRYLWFNIGEDRASRTHIWHHDMTVPMLAVTDASARPGPEYTAATAQDVTTIIANAQAAGETTIDVFLTEDSQLTRITFSDAIRAGASTPYAYTWLESLRCMHITFVE